MKTNRIYIIAAVCLLFGLAVFAIGFTMMGLDITKFNTNSQYAEKSFVSTRTVSGIVIDDNDLSIKIVVSNDDNVHISYYENDKEHYEIKQSDIGTLSVIKHNMRKWYDYLFNISFQTTNLTVAVPSRFLGNLSAESSNGRIDCIGVNAADMILTTSNGKITVSNLMASGKLEASTSNADDILSNVTVSGNVACDTSNGKISLENVKGKNINARTSNGAVALKSVVSNENIVANTSNQQIYFDNIKFGTGLDCNSSNGAVKGNIAGKLVDYTITSKTSNGKDNLPERMSGGAKTIDITTSNGGIEINFIG
jgi:DUF4097 and DUF4098 domain-containing protein YvlB